MILLIVVSPAPHIDWGLRDYGVEGQLGLEKTPEEYVAKLVEIFREVKRVLKKEGTCWLNLGDSYATQHETGTTDKAKGWTSATGIGGRQTEHARVGSGGLSSKNLVGIPWRVAFALQTDGWYLRQDLIWAKPNPMPESVTDRCTKSHEYVFLLSKSPKYYFDNEAIKEPAVYAGFDRGVSNNVSPKGITPFGGHKNLNINGKQPNSFHVARAEGKSDQEYSDRNKRSVWTITTKPFKDAHFATFPEDLIVPMVLAGCPRGGVILDPFIGAGTTGVVAKKLQRNYVGIELNEKYIEMANQRIKATPSPMF